MRLSISLCTALIAASLTVGVSAQIVEHDVAVVSEAAASQIPAFSYREGPESELAFRGTSLVPAGEGSGQVAFRDGRSRIGMKVRNLPDPWTLGAYTTYVLWAVTLEGRASNLGAIEVNEGRASLNTAAPLSQFALIVTAEPHFAVTVPSKAVVLQNFAEDVKGHQDTVRTLAERADYSALAQLAINPRDRTPLDLYQARYAMAIANAAEASKYAPQAFAHADQLMKAAEAAQISKKSAERKMVAQTSRDAVQAAEDARREALLAKTTADQQEHEQMLTTATAAAAAKRAHEVEAETQARQQLAAAAAKRHEATVAADAADAAGLAESEKARQDLTERLNRALPTTDTERGLVAQISGVQFASGGAGLAVSARESLARFSGIVLTYPEMRFVVEGHTDTVGKEATNTALSLKRAITVRDYLIAQGVPASAIDVKGLGPTAPVADNATAAGRAANRRVAIVMSGGPIGATKQTPLGSGAAPQ